MRGIYGVKSIILCHIQYLSSARFPFLVFIILLSFNVFDVGIEAIFFNRGRTLDVGQYRNDVIQSLPLPLQSLRSKLYRSFFWSRNIKYGPEANFHRLTTPDLLDRAGFSSERQRVVHRIVTDDGYILSAYRIIPKSESVPGREGETERLGKRAVLFLPGLLACGSSWLTNTPDKNLPMILASRGDFDPWILDVRGCTPFEGSKQHLWKNPKSTEFWDFSWHELGVFDLKAGVDYILNITGQSQLTLIGHSQGTTMIYVLLAELPDYNAKVNMSISLSPSAFKSNALGSIPLSARLVPLLPKFVVSDILSGGSQVFSPPSDFWHNILTQLCENENYKELCLGFVFTTVGFDWCQAQNVSLSSELAGIVPMGSSVWTIVHFAQLINSGNFQKFDYGVIPNLIKYGQRYPPKYNLSNIQSPQIFFYGDNDWLSTPKDVAKLAVRIPKEALKGVCRIKYKKFNHLDFIIAKDINVLLNNRVIRVLDGRSCWEDDNPESDLVDEPGIQCPVLSEDSSPTRQVFAAIETVINPTIAKFSNFVFRV